MPTTLHLDAANPSDIFRAAELLRAGSTVAFATETVYGLGANALSASAVEEIFLAKQRPAWDPLIVHIASTADLSSIVTIPAVLDVRIAQLSAAFWPGPLTLLLPRNANIPDAVTAGRPLVGVRIPSHPAAQKLLRAAAIPIAAPSANTFGHTSPTTAAHVLDDLNGRIAAVLDAGPTPVGLESTVLDPTQTPMLLYRPGAITPEQLTAATGVAVKIFAATLSDNTTITDDTPKESLPSPGVGIRHYAPRARLLLTEGEPAALLTQLQAHFQAQLQSPTSIGVLLPKNWPTDPRALTEPWADWNDSAALAAMLFAALRSLDDRGAAIILCPKPTPGGLADAILDRLQKASRD